MSDLGKKVVLLVDDEKDFLDSLQVWLSGRDYSVICAKGGDEAKSIIEERNGKFGDPKVDAIVSDWMMAKGDGIELLKWVRSGQFKSLRFILMSGAVTEEQLKGTFKFKPDGVLLKPFDLQLMVEKIEGN